ncbi:MAG TPA: alpha/beta hydrolase [Acidimicrobiales bacterium]|nr:alpha/beta hydrolase [Acidimicrobiales bacterium]
MNRHRPRPTGAIAVLASGAAAAADRVLIAGSRRSAAWALSPSASWPTRRHRADLLTWAAPPASGVRVERGALAGRPAERYEPSRSRRPGTVLYLHGGGFTVGSPRGHRAMVSRFAAAAGMVVHSLDYRLAPEHPFPAAQDDVWEAYLEVREAEVARARAAGEEPVVVLAGDSAGGALSLTASIRAITRAMPGPSALVLVCPAADMRPEAGAQRRFGPREPLLTAELMDVFADSYAAGHDRSDPELSPLAASDDVLAQLPPIVLDSCGDDPLRWDAEQLAARLGPLGVPVDHVQHARRFHDFHLMAGLVPPAGRALDALGVRLRAALAAPIGEAR